MGLSGMKMLRREINNKKRAQRATKSSCFLSHRSYWDVKEVEIQNRTWSPQM